MAWLLPTYPFGKINIPLVKTMDISLESRCVELLRKTRWPGGVSCPRCKTILVITVGHMRTFPEHKRYYCSACGYTFSDTSMTVFHSSRLPLSKWFDAIVLRAKGASAMDIKNRLHVTYKTAWRIKHSLKEEPLVQKIRRRLLKED